MFRRFRFWLARDREDEDLTQEIGAHIAIEARQRIEAGESPEQAWSEARRVFGNPARLKEETREAWGSAPLERFIDDVRFGFRMLRKSPVWSFVVGATLALGIGLTTAVFSLVYSVLLQPLPYAKPGALMALWVTGLGSSSSERMNVNPSSWRDWKERTHSFSSIALTRPIANFNLTGEGTPERLQGARISANLMEVLGVAPMLGREFHQSEELTDAHVAILSHALWKTRFGADSSIVGRRIELNGMPYEVVGVMPPEFRYPSDSFALWTPLFIPAETYRLRVEYGFISVARLREGVTRRQAQADLNRVMAQLATDFPATNKGRGALVQPLLESLGNDVGKTLYVLLASSLCLLFIGCINLSVLLIGRASARAKEMSLRAALGASGSRLSRQILAEMLPFALFGSAGGTALAWTLLHGLRPWLPPDLPRINTIGLYPPVLLFSAGISLLVVMLAALIPARAVARHDPARALQRESRTHSGNNRIRDILVIAQVSLALVLVFGAGLFGRSLEALMRVNPGFAPEGVLTMHLAVTRANYPSDAQVADYYRRLAERVESLPGVVAAGFVNRLPLTGIAQVNPIVFERNPSAESISVDTRSITPDYLAAMGIPLLRGRAFTYRDTASTPPVAIIDEQLAHGFFRDEDPVGRRLRIQFNGIHGDWIEIAGVAGHIRNDSPEAEGRSQIYFPETQNTQDRAALAVRTSGDPGSLASQVIGQIHAIDPNQPVYDVRTMRDWVGRSRQSRDLMTALIALFSAASLALTCLGLYGVVSYMVELRQRELAIRLALGAPAGRIPGMVLRHAGKLAAWGCLAGLLAFWPIGRVIRTLLFGVGSGDLFTLITAPLLLVVVAASAALRPAIRAGKIDPAEMLRAE